MGRWVLGILAVAVLQIAFSVYMSHKPIADPTTAAVTTNVPEGNAGLNAMNDPGMSEPLAPISADNDRNTTSSAKDDKVVPIETRRSTELLARRTQTKNRRSPAVAVLRPSIRYLENAEQASVERQYFGRMVVERTFWPAKIRANQSSASVRRQTFGRLVVKRTSGV